MGKIASADRHEPDHRAIERADMPVTLSQMATNESSVDITFEDGSTTLAGGLPMVANGSITLDLDGQPWFTCTRANNFTIGNSGNLQVSGAVYYTQTNYS